MQDYMWFRIGTTVNSMSGMSSVRQTAESGQVDGWKRLKQERRELGRLPGGS